MLELLEVDSGEAEVICAIQSAQQKNMLTMYVVVLVVLVASGKT